MARPRFATVVSLLALFLSLGGTVYAAAKINGKTIKKGSIPANRLKAESVGGAQVNEASLGQVPSTARADSAGRADLARRVESAPRAETAARVDFANQAARAGLAPEADHAKAADRATLAETAGALEGLSKEQFAQHCERGGVRAVLEFNPEVATSIAPGFNCKDPGAPLTIVRHGNGEYTFTLKGIEGTEPRPLVFGSARGINATVVVDGAGPEFRARVFSTKTEVPASTQPFTLVFF